MAVDLAAPAPGIRTLSRARLLALPARAVLGGIVALSVVVRCVAAAAHVTPYYFPDEYLYPALARGFAAGDGPVVRGAVVHFPALLEPLLTAPFWLFGDPALALRLTQGLHAVAMSLAAVPVYLLARRLSLSPGLALGCALVAVACPDLLYASFTLSDPIAYPLVLAGVYAGVCALDRPTRSAQVAFFAFASLSTFARVQYAALPLAFALAAVVLERRRVLSRYRLSLALFGVPALGVLALGTGKLLGAYSGVATVGFHPAGILHWALNDAMLLVYATGVVLVPGALVGLLAPRRRVELAFSLLALSFTVALLLQAGFIADFDSQRVQERYFFPVVPLAAPAFCLALGRGRNALRAALLVAVGILLLSVRVPLAGYAAAHGKDDSPTLTAVLRLEQLVTTADGSLAVALLAAVLAFGGAALLRGRGAGGLLVAALAGTALSLGAHSFDARNAHMLRTSDMPADARWVDHAHLGPVALVQAPGSVAPHALEALWWNTSLTRELVLGTGTATDHFGGAERMGIRRDGTLDVAGAAVRQPLLVQTYGARLWLANATLVRTAYAFQLFRVHGTPRAQVLADGWYFDGWLARDGAYTVWPDAGGRTRGTFRVTLSLPANAAPTTVRLGAKAIALAPGASHVFVWKVDATGPQSLRFATPRGGGYASDNRAISVRASTPTFARG